MSSNKDVSVGDQLTEVKLKGIITGSLDYSLKMFLKKPEKLKHFVFWNSFKLYMKKSCLLILFDHYELLVNLIKYLKEK